MYDCIIIGGGLSGLTCGIKCAKEGLRTAIFSGGMNSLHFSSGSIDLIGYNQHEKIYHPFKFLKKINRINPEHPYSKIPVKIIRESLDFIKSELANENLFLNNNNELNHFHITALGMLKPTYLSQETVFNERLKQALKKKSGIALLNFEGFRDYFPEMTLYKLKKNSIFRDIPVTIGTIRLSFLEKSEKNYFESRSIDIARMFETEKYLPVLAQEIKRAAGNAEIASLPAFIGLNNYNKINKKLSELTGMQIYEIPCLPPSIMGMRIDSALKSRFASLGGEFIAGDKVSGGEIINGKIDHIHTENYGDARHHARFYVISTGSFFSNGLQSEYNRMMEPVFKLKFNWSKPRNKWYSKSFFEQNSHPFLSFGIITNKFFHPYNKDNKIINNLFCTGGALSGYDPVKEGSGSGVAIATAYYSALKIITEIAGK